MGKIHQSFLWKGIFDKRTCCKLKSSISLQKHRHRSEYWTVESAKPKITINKFFFFKNPDESIFVPRGSIHRIENIFKKPVKIMEVQIGSILKETDIIRYKDVYGRVN